MFLSFDYFTAIFYTKCAAKNIQFGRYRVFTKTINRIKPERLASPWFAKGLGGGGRKSRRKIYGEWMQTLE